ncbi:unnamed protein product [Cylindrotheca closterium]|uniref:F-box domain-containing protein n=1 Tax=Cylindrotheca closterium TaxID=2856 RepID=A0AAD2G515_9STRA|nr:unnamed protein product [Cylindrotheca closterium]
MATADSTSPCTEYIHIAYPVSPIDRVTWVDLPDALWHEILRFSAVQDLVRMERVCKKFNIQLDRKDRSHGAQEQGREREREREREQEQLSSIHDLWKTHCQHRWNDKPRYKLTDEREDWLRRHYDEHFATVDYGDTAGGATGRATGRATGSRTESSHVMMGNAAPFPVANTASSSPSTTSTPSLSKFSWKKTYFWMEQELARTTLTYDELESLDWYFNFTPLAGGRGKDTLLRCIFRHGLLSIGGAGFPSLPYRMLFLHPGDNPDIFSEQQVNATDQHSDTDTTTDATTDTETHDNPIFHGGIDTSQARRHNQEQAVLIADFPLHYVSRLHDSGEWLMTNAHVTFVSTDEAGALTYKDRNFQ